MIVADCESEVDSFDENNGEVQYDILKTSISAFLKTCCHNHPDSVATKDICDKFLPIPGPSVERALFDIVNDGEAYRTIDDEHFAVF